MTAQPKKSKAPLPFADARKACRTPAEHEQLALVVRDGWTSAELHEFARLHFFKNGLDHPTALSYRRAIADIVRCRMVSYVEAEPGYGPPNSWLKLFREGGSKPLPPRREGLLQRGRGLAEVRCDWHGYGSVPNRISYEEYAWPGHTEGYRSRIEQRARDYFEIAPDQPVHVNAWAASQRAYWREQKHVRKQAEMKAKALKKPKAPKSPKKSGPRKLARQFNMNWEGHTAAFREEVAAWARKDEGLPSDAYIGPAGWKRACNKHYELTESITT
jgi:hypothetical protein